MGNFAISVVIPVRNRSGPRLGNCLRSLRWQNLPAARIELVISDYGSDADHAASVDELAAQASAVVRRTEQGGLWNRSRALNIGIQAARGELVMCTDADMIFAADFLAQVLAVFARTDRAMVVSNCHDLPEDVRLQSWQAADFEILLARSHKRDTTGTGACQVAQREFFEAVRGYDEAFEHWGAEDDDMLHRAQACGLQVHRLPDSTAMLHQWHPTMKNAKWLQRKRNEWRLKLTRHVIVKNKASWGSRGVA